MKSIQKAPIGFEKDRTECRPAHPSDKKSLMEIENSSFDYYRLKERNFSYLIKARTSDIIVAEVSGEICGYSIVLYHKRRKSARLYSIAVHPDCRKRGIGKILMDRSVETARARGVCYLDLEVKSQLTKLVSYYEKFGFVRCSVTKDYYGKNIDGLKLRLNISEKILQGQGPSNIFLYK